MSYETGLALIVVSGVPLAVIAGAVWMIRKREKQDIKESKEFVDKMYRSSIYGKD